MTEGALLRKGSLSFSVQTRILKELGERLVKQPEVALLELVKNAYDADARTCVVNHGAPDAISVVDDGTGITLEAFEKGWMSIGSSAKASTVTTPMYGRRVTGEKGIGRFAVRFLGRHLRVSSVADDPGRGRRTQLDVEFDWTEVDQAERLGQVKVPYRLTAAPPGTRTGTSLYIDQLREGVGGTNWNQVRTGSVPILSPLAFIRRSDVDPVAGTGRDPGFSLRIVPGGKTDDELGGDTAAAILESYVLRADLSLTGTRLQVRIYRRGVETPVLEVVDTMEADDLGDVSAEIRFIPRRSGTLAGVPLDGRRAYSWVRENSGVAIFDRAFRVSPYGFQGDDWLKLGADAVRNARDPSSSITRKHFRMTDAVRREPSQNWMIRLPEPSQVIGIVNVEGRRNAGDNKGLIAAADREGFVDNTAYRQLVDIVRGAVEMIAVADRELEQAQQRQLTAQRIAKARAETRSAIEAVGSDPDIPPARKQQVIAILSDAQQRVEQAAASEKERERQLEVMSLLGVLAGFMTHEFGVALAELRLAHKQLKGLSCSSHEMAGHAERLGRSIKNLEEFSKYVRLYTGAARTQQSGEYPVRPRISQIVRMFEDYAEKRLIKVEIEADDGLKTPQLPLALYNGIVQNLFTNALKAVTAKAGKGRRVIALRAWNEKGFHHLQVLDTGVGVPAPLKERVFDPLFTTTDDTSDALGSGMGLGLSLVRRGAEVFGGKAALVDPPAGFATCVHVRFPLTANGGA